eukprot:TRINITY_DN1866_c0_g1_i1.p1 TRINITY_DN1866_c0_g1~~TRINITY_DN1866_c0_g1_i1.p1  ORF type:complete len:183 (-),score=50.64 TRINITY_DN1866_c0_g1_i1:82-588(-)
MASVVEYGSEAKNYKWTQTDEEVIVNLKVQPGIRGRDILCEIKPNKLKVQIKGSTEPLIDGELCKTIKTDESTWCLDNGNMEITLRKVETTDEKKKWWKCVVLGDPEIDVELIEASKYLDESLLRQIKEKKANQKLAENSSASASDSASTSTSSDSVTTDKPASSEDA